MSAATLLSRLDGVRKTGNGWHARCPAHEDRSPSLSVAEGDGGRVLVHCFAGCPVGDVLAAVGLSLTDLFAERIEDRSPMARAQRRDAARAGDLAAAVAVLGAEAAVVEAAAHAIADGALLDTDDLRRLALAAQRIHDARGVLA